MPKRERSAFAGPVSKATRITKAKRTSGTATWASWRSFSLPPSDGPLLQAAVNASRVRVWATIRPLCASPLGDDFADKMRAAWCENVIMQAAKASGVDVVADMRAVAEMRAGLCPFPEDGGGDAFTKLLLLTPGESSVIEHELAKQVGTDEAKRHVFDEGSPACWHSFDWVSRPH